MAFCSENSELVDILPSHTVYKYDTKKLFEQSEGKTSDKFPTTLCDERQNKG